MRRAQKALADFLRPIDWSRFARRNLQDVVLEGDQAAVFACADGDQALLWLLRTDAIGAAGMSTTPNHRPLSASRFQPSAPVVTGYLLEHN